MFYITRYLFCLMFTNLWMGNTNCEIITSVMILKRNCSVIDVIILSWINTGAFSHERKSYIFIDICVAIYVYIQLCCWIRKNSYYLNTITILVSVQKYSCTKVLYTYIYSRLYEHSYWAGSSTAYRTSAKRRVQYIQCRTGRKI